jgi:hypothetical protein
MTEPWIVVIGVAAVGALYVVVPVASDAFFRYRRKRSVRCPETGGTAEVKIDAVRAALDGAAGRPGLHVQDCSLWPQRRDCERACVTQR